MIALTLSTLGCADGSSSQIVILMDTDYAVPEEVDKIRARVSKVVETDDGSREIETWLNVFPVSKRSSSEPGVYRLPATFGILSGGSSPGQEVVIELEALASESGEALVSRRLKTGFVSQQARLARMLLFRTCADLVCPAGESCGCAEGKACTEPKCVDESVSPEALERIDEPDQLPADPEIPLLDAGVPDGGVLPDGGGQPDASVPDGGVISCEPPLVLCGMDCVNPDADPRYCGDCETACVAGHVCSSGICVDPGDCRRNGVGCSGFTFCDEASGECLPGCTEAQQCVGANEFCDTGIHDCVCAPNFERCNGVCVDTRSDPDFCGDCTRSCLTGQVCAAGSCLDLGDCRTNGTGCTGFTYCDPATGDCLRGCEDAVQCVGGNETCDLIAHECVCSTGFHRCGSACVSDLDVNSCGNLCSPCPAPSNASATCNLGECDFICDDTYEACGQTCCPTECPSGQELYNGSCAKIHLQIVDEEGKVGENSSLALDPSGRAHVAYYANSGGDLRYAAQQLDDSWTSEKPDGKDDVGRDASIAFDAKGLPHVAYHNASENDLMLATRQAGGAWTVQIVDGNGDVGEHASVAFDSAGEPHIGYYDSSNKDLMYATRRSGDAWVIQVVDAIGDVGEYTSVAVDPSDHVHISYYDASGRNLKHASRQPDGSWRAQTVDSDGDVGKYTTMAFDPFGVAHIAYYRESGQDLRYAVAGDNGSWAAQTVDSQASVGKYASLAVDATGLVHISYYDESTQDLKHAVRGASQSWVLQTVDSFGDVGKYTSIAVDDLGRAHVSYYDASNTNLKYALIAAPE
ncbi:MAG: hypothetical protein HKN10_04945 [Myxococcales bacterium]|nr:hypothetical protein [Myxococcales bacterium]